MYKSLPIKETIQQSEDQNTCNKATCRFQSEQQILTSVNYMSFLLTRKANKQLHKKDVIEPAVQFGLFQHNEDMYRYSVYIIPDEQT